MSGLQKLSLTVALCLLLLTTLLPGSEAWRGGSSFSRVSSHHSSAYRPVQSSGFGGGKVAGAAAKGAIGGEVDESVLNRPGHQNKGSRKKKSGGGGGGRQDPRPTYTSDNSGDMKYYTGASSGPIYNSVIVVNCSLMSLLMGHWVAVM